MLRGVETYAGEAEEERREREKIVVVEAEEKVAEVADGKGIEDDLVKEVEDSAKEQPPVVEDVTEVQ